MATNKPRITISMSPNLHETFKRFAQLQGRPMSSVIVEILESIHPPLMRTIALLEAAQDAPKQVRDGLRSTVENMEMEFTRQQVGALAQMDWLFGQMGGAGGGGAGAAPHPAPAPLSGAKSGSNPRTSNTGVRSSKTPTPSKVKKASPAKKKTPRGSTVSKKGRA